MSPIQTTISSKADANPALRIPDSWFKEFYQLLEQYNFTIDENTTVDSEVSVDPEMMGRIFENLLAEVNPETGETARKATGSYYTPRVIVDYMVEQSLKQYLVTKTSLTKDKCVELLSYETEVNGWPDSEKVSVVKALKEIKIIDPACGSGAFPMGILHRIILVLEKVDPLLKIWQYLYMESLDKSFREVISESVTRENWSYLRKLITIREAIFGVDIQEIAVEIAKLRCFLSLVVDEHVNDDVAKNRGIKPLPNLEFKFVAANSLIGLPKSEGLGGMFEDLESIKKLAYLRKEYFNSYSIHKKELEEQFKEVQRALSKHHYKHSVLEKRDLTGNVTVAKTTAATQTQYLASWQPFENTKCKWFDSDWMFGVPNFDIVIANPPYLSAWTMTKKDSHERNSIVAEFKNYDILVGHWDLYMAFILKGHNILRDSGILSYILPNPVLREKYASSLRKFMLTNMTLHSLLIFDESNVFENVSRKTVVITLLKDPHANNFVSIWKNSCWEEDDSSRIEHCSNIDKDLWMNPPSYRFLVDSNEKHEALIDKIERASIKVGNICYVNYGAQVSSKISGEFKKRDVISYEPVGNAKKFYEGKDVHRWAINWRGLWLDYRKRALYGPRTEKLFESPKITIRKVSDKNHKIGAAFDKTGMYCDDGLVLVVPFQTLDRTDLDKDFTDYARINTDISLEYLTAQFLSSLCNYYYRCRFATESLQQATSHVYPQAVRALPIRNISFEEQKPFIDLVNQILDTIGSEDYLTNPKKQKGITDLEHQIDRMVYDLYELTEEEVAMVEGRA